MISRILVAVIGIPLLLFLLLFCPTIGLAMVIGLLSAIAVFELLGSTGYLQRRAMLAATIALAFLVPLWFYFGASQAVALGALLLFLMFLFSCAFASGETVTLGHIGACLLAGVLIPTFLSSFLMISDMENDKFLILLPFVSAFCSDGAALFTGILFGRHKLAPVLSPHKTIEGSIGGFLGSVLACVIYGYVVQALTGVAPNVPVLALYGVLGSAVSQFGDLAFSYIKRQFDIKDYGHIFLAHGGVLDRFDSVIFCAPLTTVMVSLLPFFYFT